MNITQFQEKLIENFKITDLNDVIEKFSKYKHFLQEKNKVMNLTRLDEEAIIYQDYFFNSLIPFIGADLKNKQILDIGSGSGIPGIALKIIEPTINLTIIESNNKKVSFLKDLVDVLSLANVTIINNRAEIIQQELVEAFDIVTSRAVANLAILIEISCKYIKLGGLLIEPKSINYEYEWNQIKNNISAYGLELIELKKYDNKNYIFYFKKTHQSHPKYPRSWTQIIKEFK